MKLKKILVEEKSRLSGTGSFPAPQKIDIGKEVVVTRPCITWSGCLGYFKEDKEKTIYAFYLEELGNEK